MTAIREQILAWIAAAHVALPSQPEVERDPSADPTRYPSYGIVDGGQEPIEREAGTVRYELTVKIEGYVEGGSGTEACAARNALYADTVAIMMAEPPINGLAELVEEGRLVCDTAELASKRRLGFLVDFTIQYATRRGDPAQL